MPKLKKKKRKKNPAACTYEYSNCLIPSSSSSSYCHHFSGYVNCSSILIMSRRDFATPSAGRKNYARPNEYFVPHDGIVREVITRDICRYLGNDALVRPGTYEVSRRLAHCSNGSSKNLCSIGPFEWTSPARLLHHGIPKYNIGKLPAAHRNHTLTYARLDTVGYGRRFKS